MSTVLVVIVPDKNSSMSIHGDRMVKTLTNVCKAQDAAMF